jgi:hypothetical protein
MRPHRRPELWHESGKSANANHGNRLACAAVGDALTVELL